MRKESGFHREKRDILHDGEHTIKFRRLESENHRCPKFPLVDENRGVCSETHEKQEVMIDGINQFPAPLFLPF